MDVAAGFILIERFGSTVPGPVGWTSRGGSEVDLVIFYWWAIYFQVKHKDATRAVLIKIVKQDKELFLTIQHLSKFQWIKQHANIAVSLMVTDIKAYDNLDGNW